MLLILALFQTADESMGRNLKPHAPFVDKHFLVIGHSLYPQSTFNLNWKAPPTPYSVPSPLRGEDGMRGQKC
ncbi:MAG: hypothetical protein A2157_13420 [Deltaproteobacteria bacterium RBG_16_47_11]|nr:MAG: hypothetical protein A2157_13420 [Deltaproteobacteria bacterium RBG_16_47_11]